MKLPLNYKNRREFLKKLLLSTAVIGLTPEFTFGKTSNINKIGFGFYKTPPEIILKISNFFIQNNAFIIKESHKNADILFINSLNDLTQSKSEFSNNTFLIINHQNLDSNSLSSLQSYCNNHKTFLLIVEENLTEKAKVLFSKASLYEPSDCDTSKIENTIKSINFLCQLTEQNNFIIYNQSINISSKLV